MLGHGAGSEVMQRIAAPMVGGMVTAPLLSMFVIPAAWLLLKRRQVRREIDGTSGTHVPSAYSGEMK
jgi:Cu(I)/Ag(I) efflux system membrane protein CusA/SilA